MANTYDVGDSVTVKAAFVNSASAPADPTTVVLRVKAPDGVVTTPTPQHPSTGAYETVIVPDEPGKWLYRWEGAGGVDAAGEGYFMVRRSEV